MPVTLIDQLTPFTCPLACLESYFADIQKPRSQAEMLKQHFHILRNPADPRRDYGAASDAQIIGICTDLGFQAGLYMDFRQNEVETAFDDALKKKKGVLIMANWANQSQHCVRLSAIKSPGLYEVMCPMFGSQKSMMIDVTFPDLVQWGFRFLIIS